MIVSYYKTGFDNIGSDIEVDSFINNIQTGVWSTSIEKIRAAGTKKERGELKKALPGVTISGAFEKRRKDDLIEHSGLLCLDFDGFKDEQEVNEAFEKITADQYTYAAFRSASGLGIAAIAKIDKKKHLEAWRGFDAYYAKKYNLLLDPAAKDITRLRFASYDPDTFRNAKAKTFKEYVKEKKQKPAPARIIISSEFDEFIKRIQDSGRDITNSDYSTYIKIGFALNSEFGAAGEQYFHAVCQYSPEYDADRAARQYKHCSSPSEVNIGTLYHLAKEIGVEPYTQEFKSAIITASQCKRRGNSGLPKEKQKQAILNQLEATSSIPKEEAEQIADKVVGSIAPLDKGLSEDISNIEKLDCFVKEQYSPLKNAFTLVTEVNVLGKKSELTDSIDNEIYFESLKAFNGDFTVHKSDVISVLDKESVPQIDPVIKFVNEHEKETEVNLIDEFVECMNITTGMDGDDFDGDFANEFVKKWLCSMFAYMDGTYSPLFLVLCGGQGVGKSYVINNLLPKSLQKYCVENNLNNVDKDLYSLMASSLIILADEFGGKTVKKAEEMKELVSMNHINCRPPYGRRNIRRKRVCIFAGTSNREDILADSTGNRRVIPLNVERLNFERFKAIDKDRLFMQVYGLYKSGFSYDVGKEDIERLNKNTTQFEVLSMEHELINTLGEKVDEHEHGLTRTEICESLNKNRSENVMTGKVSGALKKLGYTSKSIKKDGRTHRKFNIMI